MIFSLAWNIVFSDNFKVLVLKFLEIKNMVFLSQKVDGDMIFTDYWKVLVLTFSEMGNTVFSRAKSWRKFLILNFSVIGNTVFFFSQEVDGKIIFTWSFWAFYNIPGPGKYGFSRSARILVWQLYPAVLLKPLLPNAI